MERRPTIWIDTEPQEQVEANVAGVENVVATEVQQENVVENVATEVQQDNGPVTDAISIQV